MHCLKVLLPAALLLLAAASLLPPGAQWITDNGNKYMIMRQIAATKSPVFSSETPDFFPTGGFHFIQTGKTQFRSFYAEYLPKITAPLYGILGDAALLFYPMLGTLALLLLYYKWRRSVLETFLLLLTTPFWFYSLVYWEMTPAAALAFAGFLAAFNGWNFRAGLLIGLGLLFREESYFAAAALGLALLSQRNWKGAVRFGSGFLVAALPLWLWQYWDYGHFLGLHGSCYYLNNRSGSFNWRGEFAGAGWNYYFHWFGFGLFTSRAANLAVTSLGIVAVVLGAATRRHRWISALKAAVWLAAGVLWLAGISIGWGRADAMYAAAATVGTITTVPLLWWALLNWRELAFKRGKTIGLISRTALFYLLIVPPLLTRNDIGIIWGARYFLAILPLFFALGANSLHGVSRQFFSSQTGIAPKLKSAAVLLAAVSGIGFQFFGTGLLAANAANARALENKIIEKTADTVVSDVFFLPEMTPRAFFAKRWFYADSDLKAARLAEVLRRSDVRDFTLVLSPDTGFRQLGNMALRRFLAGCEIKTEPEVADFSAGNGFLKLIFVDCRLKSAAFPAILPR